MIGLFLALGLVMRIGRSLTSEFNHLVTFPYASSYLGAGILTCLPSPTPIGLGLGPD